MAVRDDKKLERYCDRCAGKIDPAKMVVFQVWKPHMKPISYNICRECLIAFARWMEEEE